MKRFAFLLAVMALFFVGCQQAEIEVEVEEVEDAGPISQTFESENGTFSYTLTWHPDLLTLVDDQYEGATENAPSFDITGGGHISLRTGWIDAPGVTMADFVYKNYYEGIGGDWPSEDDDELVEAGEYDHSNETHYFDKHDGSCWFKYAVLPAVHEALAFRMEDCDGNDMKVGEAFGDLVTDVVIEIHE